MKDDISWKWFIMTLTFWNSSAERIGDAEVLEVHTEASSPSQEEELGLNSA